MIVTVHAVHRTLHDRIHQVLSALLIFNFTGPRFTPVFDSFDCSLLHLPKDHHVLDSAIHVIQYFPFLRKVRLTSLFHQSITPVFDGFMCICNAPKQICWIREGCGAKSASLNESFYLKRELLKLSLYVTRKYHWQVASL